MTKENKLLLILFFNFSIMFMEVIGGVLSKSLALFSDAGHMLTDSFALFLSYIAIKWSQKPATHKKTFGYHRTEVLATLINGITLLLIAIYIFYEAAHRIKYPVTVKTDILLSIAFIGLIGNLIGIFLLKNESHDNMNIRGAFFHLLSDTLSSLGVISGGILISLTKWNIVDPIISIIIGGLIFRNAISLLRESGEVLLESTPHDIDLNSLRTDVEKIEGIKEFHDIHIWTITSGKRALSAHIMIDNIDIKESQKITKTVKELLKNKFNITHITLETECDNCTDSSCEFDNGNKNGDKNEF